MYRLIKLFFIVVLLFPSLLYSQYSETGGTTGGNTDPFQAAQDYAKANGIALFFNGTQVLGSNGSLNYWGNPSGAVFNADTGQYGTYVYQKGSFKVGLGKHLASTRKDFRNNNIFNKFLTVKLPVFEFKAYNNQSQVKQDIANHDSQKIVENNLNHVQEQFDAFSKASSILIINSEKQIYEVNQVEVGSDCYPNCGRPDVLKLEDKKGKTKFSTFFKYKNQTDGDTDLNGLLISGTRDGVAEGILNGPVNNPDRFIRDLESQIHSDLLNKAKKLIDNLPSIIATQEDFEDYEKDFADVFRQLGGQKNQIVAKTFDKVSDNKFLGLKEHLKIASNAKRILEITRTEEYDLDDINPNDLKIVTRKTLEVRILDAHGDLVSSYSKETSVTEHVSGLADAIEVKEENLSDKIFNTWLKHDPVTASNFLRIKDYYNFEKEQLRKQHPDWNESRLVTEAWISVGQTGLDVAGLAPVIGNAADLVNGGIYLVRGDLVNAGISAAAMLPITGQLAGGTRLGNKVVKYVDDVAVFVTQNAAETEKLIDFTKNADKAIDGVTSGARVIEDGTGTFRKVGGHHPMAKKAFEGAANYNPRSAFSVSNDALKKAWKEANPNLPVPRSVHGKVTGQQNSLYTSWKNANPGKTISVDDMAKIEVQAMKNAGISEDVAKGWAKKAVEDLKGQGVFEIKNIPWNGVNP